jgi:hypothetical protein
MFRSALVLLVALLSCGSSAKAQGLDSVWVETYHVWDSLGANGKPLVTYRIWVDMAPGYLMQVVYGDRSHDLEVSTTTEFVNTLDNSVKYADQRQAMDLKEYPLALDSWFTIGAASNKHMGVPLHLDKDGSVLKCPPYPKAKRGAAKGNSLCRRDGLLVTDSIAGVVNWRFEPGYLGDIRGGVIHTMDGAWAVLGGIPGVTEQNQVMVAQLTTSGELSFKLNIQVATTDRVATKFVHIDPSEGETMLPSLSYGKFRR